MRHRPPDRLDRLIQAAARVFGARGYRRTQMADVARAMGVAPGTLYSYVAGKEALFHLVVDRAFPAGAAAPPPALPVPTPAPAATLERLWARLRAEAALPTLEAALAGPDRGEPRAELEAIVRELYGLVERARDGIALLERSALDWPDLAHVFYAEMRRGLVARLTRYLELRARSGRLRAVPHSAAAARLVLENVAVFAMHRHRDPDPGALDDTAARETVVDLLVHALAPPGPRHPEPGRVPRGRPRRGGHR